ncbi:MAG: glycosyltransferase [Flavobacteriia bacterium]|nr:glycosyltransferase [Flavobacteriia bacterium]
MTPRIAVAVTNDLTTDQRVQRTISVLQDLGAEVTFIGRLLPNSQPFTPDYRIRRFKLMFKSGALFYATYNLRLFWHLLWTKYDGYVANDLDTLLAVGLASAIKRKPFIYDSHEFFTGVPEIQDRPAVVKTWKWIERKFYHKAQARVTVNESISRLLSNAYGGEEPAVVRNIGKRPDRVEELSRQDLGLPEEAFIFINQGAGINVDRGMEEALEAIEPLSGAVLLIVGNGDAVPRLKRQVVELGIEKKVIFVDKVPYARLLSYTRVANVGLSLDKPTSINYMYSLPNKLFDYLHSDIPVLTSQVVEVKKIVDEYNVGITVNSSSVEALREGLKKMMDSPSDRFNKGIARAKAELNWPQERKVLADLLRPFLKVQ